MTFWAKEKRLTLLVNDEEFNVTIKIPLAAEWEEALPELGTKWPKWSNLVKRFAVEASGLGISSVDELLATPGAGDIVRTIGEEIINASSLGVTLKNVPGSSLS